MIRCAWLRWGENPRLWTLHAYRGLRTHVYRPSAGYPAGRRFPINAQLTGSCVTAAASCLALTLSSTHAAFADETLQVQPTTANGITGKLPEGVSSAYTKTLPGGLTVSLIEVSTRRAENTKPGAAQQRIYWKPDGTRTAKSSLDGAGVVGTLAKLPGIESLTPHEYKFAFLFKGLASGQSSTVARSSGQEFTQSLSAYFGDTRVTACSCEEKENKRDESFKIGVTAPNWTTEVRVPISQIHTGGSQLDADLNNLVNGHVPPHSVRIARPDSKSSMFEVLFGVPKSTDAASVERKVTLLDRDGKELDVTATMSANGRNYAMKLLDVSHETAQRVAFVLVETRATSYVTIDHVSLEPKGRTQ